MIETLTQFGSSIWQWFLDNKDAIMAFFMSGQALSFIAALVMLIKNLKGTKENTASTQKLDKTLDNTNNMCDSVTELNNNFKLLKEENDNLRNDLKETENKIVQSNEELRNKLNAIIEVQSIVYTTIRDDGVRQTVNTILNNARYSEKNFKESLEKQIDEMKINFTKELNTVNEHALKSVEEIKSELNASKKAEEKMLKRKESIRY